LAIAVIDRNFFGRAPISKKQNLKFSWRWS